MSVSTLLGLSAYLFSLVILSAVLRLTILGISYIRFHLSRKEREDYEEIYKRLATQALDGPLLLSDQREIKQTSEQPQAPKPTKRPQMAPVSCHLSDPFERRFA